MSTLIPNTEKVARILAKNWIVGLTLNINVEVEPRDIFTKSHAGIFTRHNNQNVKNGDTLYIKSLDDNISADEVLLEVRSRLIDLAKLEYCTI